MLAWTVRTDILAELITGPITKIIGKPGESNINNLESELAVRAAKMKTTEHVVENCQTYGFLVIVFGKSKFKTVIGNPTVKWMTPRTPEDMMRPSKQKTLHFIKAKEKKIKYTNTDITSR